MSTVINSVMDAAAAANVVSNVIDSFDANRASSREENQIDSSVSSEANRLVNEQGLQQKINDQTFNRLDRQQISNKLSDNLDEAPDSVSMVQLANASYLKELNKYNVSY